MSDDAKRPSGRPRKSGSFASLDKLTNDQLVAKAKEATASGEASMAAMRDGWGAVVEQIVHGIETGGGEEWFDTVDRWPNLSEAALHWRADLAPRIGYVNALLLTKLPAMMRGSTGRAALRGADLFVRFFGAPTEKGLQASGRPTKKARRARGE